MFSSEWKLQTFLDLSVQVVKGAGGSGEEKKNQVPQKKPTKQNKRDLVKNAKV